MNDITKINKLFASMPYHATGFTPITDNDPLPAILENLESLKPSLDYAVELAREREEELGKYKELKQAIQLIGEVMQS